MPTSSGVEDEIIEQFRLHQEKASKNPPADLPEDHGTRRRISYTKEQTSPPLVMPEQLGTPKNMDSCHE